MFNLAYQSACYFFVSIHIIVITSIFPVIANHYYRRFHVPIIEITTIIYDQSMYLYITQFGFNYTHFLLTFNEGIP